MWRLIALFIFFLIDRLSKYFFWNKASDYSDGFFTVVGNKHIAFSLPLPELILLPLVIIFSLLVGFEFLRQIKQKNQIFFWWGLILIGALSNIVDRLQWGVVVDYINFGWWPIFNLSDSFIFIGSVVLIFLELKKSSLILRPTAKTK